MEANAPTERCRAEGDLSSLLFDQGQLRRAFAVLQDADAAAHRFGLVGRTRWFRGLRPGHQYALGRWDEALAGADEFLAEVEAGSPHYLVGNCYDTRAQIRLGRDDVRGALADAERAIELGRQTKDPQNVYPAVVTGAHLFHESGDIVRAAALADEAIAELRVATWGGQVVDCLHVLAWTLCAVGRGAELMDALPAIDVPWVRAAEAFAAGDLRTAADICGEMGAASEEAHDRLWLAEALLEQNRRTEADIELHRALAFYRSVGATHYIRKAQGLLAASA